VYRSRSPYLTALVRLLLCSALLVAPGLVAAQPAATETPTDPTASADDPAAGDAAEKERKQQEAMAKYQQGAKAFAEKRYKDAIDLFLAADSIAKASAFAYNAGLAYEKMGDTANALRWTREYLRRKPDAKDSFAAKQRIRRYELALKKKGVQQVTVLSEPCGATVLVDDDPKGVTPWTGELSPGKHRALVQLRGYQDAQRTFELTASRALDVKLELVEGSGPPPSSPSDTGQEATPAPPPPEPTEPDRPSPTDDEGSSVLGPIGWVSLGLGVAALGGALGFELARSGAEDDAANAATQIEAGDHVDTMNGHRTAAQVLVAVGAVLSAAGAVLVAVDLAGTSSDEPGAEVAVGCRGALCGLHAAGRF
jgi:tetratricopeptide (TPR) repeat protein